MKGESMQKGEWKLEQKQQQKNLSNNSSREINEKTLQNKPDFVFLNKAGKVFHISDSTGGVHGAGITTAPQAVVMHKSKRCLTKAGMPFRNFRDNDSAMYGPA